MRRTGYSTHRVCVRVCVFVGAGLLELYKPLSYVNRGKPGVRAVCTIIIINPRRACAARVTVVVLSFCLSVVLSVCLSVCLFPRFLPLRATRRPISDSNGFSATLALF